MVKKAALTSDIKEWKLKTLPGQNAKVEDLELNEKYVEIAQNCRFSGEPGSVDKRDPITYYNSSSLGTGPTLGLYRFYSKAGLLKEILIHGTTAYVGNDSAGTWTAIRTSLTDGKRMGFETAKDLCIMSNGYDNPFVYDGATDNVTWELGSAKAVVNAAAGNLDVGANYRYKIGIVVSGTEHITGAVSNTVGTGAYGKVDLSNIPLGPVGTTDRKVYRTEGGGSTFYLIATINNNSATTYLDNIADTTVTPMGVVTDAMPVGNLLKLHRERLLISGDPSFPNRIYYSNPYLPWFIQKTTNLDYMEIAADDGDSIEGIPIQLGVLACIKKNSVRRVFITSPTSGADPDSWYAEDPISFTGTPSRWSVRQTQYGVVFLGWDHWKLFTGSAVTDIIDEFDSEDILPTMKDEVFCYWTQDDILMACYSDVTVAASYNNRIMRWDFKRQALSYDTANVNCMHANTGAGDTGELLYGDSTAGYVYKADNSNLFYKLQTKTEANLGTLNGVFVGGTNSTPYIQIGSITSASSIPDNVCVLWDHPTTDPGTGWTEITDKNDSFILISTATVGTVADVSLGETSDEATISYDIYRIFKKNSTTTEYQFPDGSIVMYDQETVPVGFIDIGTVGNYIQLGTPGTGSVGLTTQTGAGGTNLQNSLAMKFIKKVGEADTWDGVSQKIYALYYAAGAPGNDFTDVTSTYSGDFLKVGAGAPVETDGSTTSAVINFVTLPSTTHAYTGSYSNSESGPLSIDGSTSTLFTASASINGEPGGGVIAECNSIHTFSIPVDITTMYFKAYAAATASGDYSPTSDNRLGIYYKQDGDVDWTIIAATYQNLHNSSASVDETFTVNLTNVVAIKAWAYGESNRAGGGGSNSSVSGIYEITANGYFTPSTVTFRLINKILGKMQDYNAAITAAQTRGTWISPGIEVNAETLGSLYWNEDKLVTDDVEFFTRTGASESAVESGTAIGTVTNATNLFTQAGHGLSNTNRITINATVMPTGLLKTVVYFVISVSGNDWQVSLTSGGSAVDFSTDGTAVTFKLWAAPLSNPNGSPITSTANMWIQYLIAFTSADTTVDNPTVEFSGGYLAQFDYSRGVTFAEAAIPFRYKTGFRHFDLPWVDKIFKKILSYHTATAGQLLVLWETENASGTFTVDLSSNTSKFESFFPDDAWGRKLSIEYYKNDLSSLKIKEVSGLYTSEPILI